MENFLSFFTFRIFTYIWIGIRPRKSLFYLLINSHGKENLDVVKAGSEYLYISLKSCDPDRKFTSRFGGKAPFRIESRLNSIFWELQ